MADSIIILDDDEEDTPQPSSSNASSSSSSAARLANHASPRLKAQQPVPTHLIKVQQPVVPTNIKKSPARAPAPAPTHITKSPFASSKKDSHVLQAENQKLFEEFVAFCSTQTKDCPEVLQFLHVKHSKACPDFLCCAEFRNTVGRCLTRAQANPSKTFVFINELCTVLRQHSAKKRLTTSKAESSAPAPAFASPTSATPKADVKREDKVVADVEQPSTSGLQEEDTKAEDTEKERKKKKASRRQIAYLENLLKVYNDEIRRLQEKELDLDDLAADDSTYIQEHKLKRKMMKIYEKLCELKSCSPLTGRVIEQRITCTATRYPEINKKVERFINSPQSQQNAPDYSDILEQVLKANKRHNLDLPRKKLNQLAQDAFRETMGQLQERRHLDLVYNFGSHLTDGFKTASMSDPALKDRDLQMKLRANREVALRGLEEVITKYAVKQDDTEEQERTKRLQKGKRKAKSEQEEDETKEENGEVAAVENGEEAEKEESEEDEDDASSDPDIEEEIQASTQHDGQDDGDDDDDDNEAEQASESTNEEAGETEMSASASAEEGDEQKEPVTSGLDAASQDGQHGGMSPLSSELSSQDFPTQSGSPVEPATPKRSTRSSSVAVEEKAADSSNHHAAVALVSTCSASTDAMSLPPSPMSNAAPSPISNAAPSPVTRSGAKGRKRKREVQEEGNSPHVVHTIIDNGDVDIPLDMVVSSSPPLGAPLTQPITRADSPSQDLVTSSQSTPPPKKNKVNVATQCDPDEIIVLSDSE